jgi:hypothetical protein
MKKTLLTLALLASISSAYASEVFNCRAQFGSDIAYLLIDFDQKQLIWENQQHDFGYTENRIATPNYTNQNNKRVFLNVGVTDGVTFIGVYDAKTKKAYGTRDLICSKV